jgi:hypothetical protein
MRDFPVFGDSLIYAFQPAVKPIAQNIFAWLQATLEQRIVEAALDAMDLDIGIDVAKEALPILISRR